MSACNHHPARPCNLNCPVLSPGGDLLRGPQVGAPVQIGGSYSTSFITKDTGLGSRDFGTGSKRDNDQGKPFIHRIPPLVRERLGGLYRRGAEKYGDANDPVENWKKGQPLHELYASLHRHLNASEMGDESEDHDAAVMWNMASIMWTKAMIRMGKLPQRLADAFNAVVAEYNGTQVLPEGK